MKQSEAAKMLQSIMRVIQKTRSTVTEAMGSDETAVAVRENLSPKIFGHYVLEALTKVLDRHEKTGVLPPMDFYNMCAWLYRDEMLQAVCATEGFEIPIPSIEWLRGWDEDR